MTWNFSGSNMSGAPLLGPGLFAATPILSQRRASIASAPRRRLWYAAICALGPASDPRFRRMGSHRGRELDGRRIFAPPLGPAFALASNPAGLPSFTTLLRLPSKAPKTND